MNKLYKLKNFALSKESVVVANNETQARGIMTETRRDFQGNIIPVTKHERQMWQDKRMVECRLIGNTTCNIGFLVEGELDI